MKLTIKSIVIFLVLTVSGFSQVKFEDYFVDKTLRIDYFHTGDKNNDAYSIDELKEEPYWGGAKTSLLDAFNYGKYKFVVYDDSTNKELYSRTYATLFSEWQTTDEAVNTTKSFSETVVFPFPKKTVRVEFFSRNRKNELIKKFEYKINPKNYFIKKERHFEFPVFDVVNSGDPSKKIDIVLIPEGYTKAEMELFRKDCQNFAKYFFNSSPYKENKNNFNIRGVEAISEESGTDIPAENIWKKTILNSTFYTFDLERYVMTSDNKSVRDVAANAPYDQIYIIVNSEKYGGGAIFNHYACSVNKSPYGEYIFIHEFGHGFGGLADEYYTSDVAYNEFYPLDVEPLEPNLTTLVDFGSKWKHMLDKKTPVPTPDKRKYDKVLGVFEGGGYVAKGVYRPRQDCTMNSISVDNFCPVCKDAIQRMINFYIK